MKGEIDELDCACASTESSRLYLRATRAPLNYSLSSPSAGGLRRNVAQHPQRALNSSIHFTACKAIIFALSLSPPTPPHFAAGTAESAHLHMESGSLNRNVIDLPPICKGEMFPNLPGLFLHHCTTRSTGGDWIQSRERKPGAALLTCYRASTHTHTCTHTNH